MYDSPKAAHFKISPGLPSDWLQARWLIAAQVAQVVPCLLHMTPAKRLLVESILDETRAKLKTGTTLEFNHCLDE